MDKAAELISELKKKNSSLALAESITGGRASALITSVPGSSQIFSLGAIVYSLKAKHELLDLPMSELTPARGVSQAIASGLAEKVKALTGTDYGAGIVGFAGPSAPEGKLGLIYMAVSSPKRNQTRKLDLKGSRTKIQDRAALALLEFILEEVRR